MFLLLNSFTKLMKLFPWYVKEFTDELEVYSTNQKFALRLKANQFALRLIWGTQLLSDNLRQINLLSRYQDAFKKNFFVAGWKKIWGVK